MKKTGEAPKKEEKETKTKTINFVFDKETPGTMRFKEANEDDEILDSLDDQGGAIGALYVRKSFLKKVFKGVPEGAEVTIKFR